MQSSELFREKMSGLRGTFIQVIDTGFDLAKAYVTHKIEEYLDRDVNGDGSVGRSSRTSSIARESDSMDSDDMPVRRAQGGKNSGRSKRH